MKKVTLILAILMISCGPMMEVKISKTEKVIETNLTKNEIFVKSNQWMVKTFNNAESVIQFSDKESGTITGKYMLKQLFTIGLNYQTIPNGGIFAIINVDIKENKARITITPEEYQTRGKGGNPQFIYPEETARQDIEDLLNDFETYMNIKENKNW
jgi:hypothetical protein